jgi:hypothetical protein
LWILEPQWIVVSVLKKAFPNTNPVQRPIILFQEYTPYWVAGFVSGDGGFGLYARTKKKEDSDISAVNIAFYITQHIRDAQLIYSFQKYFNCGTFGFDRRTKTFRVADFNDNYNLIIPFFTLLIRARSPWY